MQSYFIANWKMQKTRKEASTLLAQFLEYGPLPSNTVAVICPPFTALDTVGRDLNTSERTRNAIFLGAQNVHWDDKGAQTGEISPAMLTDLGVSYAIVGHSERYQSYGETPENVGRRAANAMRHGIVPIICVGEKKEDYDAGTSKQVVLEQLERTLSAIPSELGTKLLIAYEPVWAIGTGLAATGETAQGIHGAIRSALKDRFGESGSEIAILYGGSTTPENIAEFMAQKDIAGALIGGASLDAEKYRKMIEVGSRAAAERAER